MSNTQSMIRCLLIPSHAGLLLLPSTVVAEVSFCHEPEPVLNNQHKWLLGIINWREQRVPFLSIEEALSLPPSSKKNHIEASKTVILYGLESTQTMPFYAFMATDVPRPLAVKEETLTHYNVDNHKGLVFNNVVFNSSSVLLPDVSYLENLLIKSQIFSDFT
jgi:chemosensory pili system protein ChpC